MRHHAGLGRHARYPGPLAPRTYIAALIAAIISVAAAIAFAAQPAATAAPPAIAVTRAHAVTITAVPRGADKTILARAHLAAFQARETAVSRIYTVRPGDTLTGIARARCGTARDWTGIYAASRKLGWTAWDADQLTAGQHLYLACGYIPSMLDRATTVIRVTAVTWGNNYGTRHVTWSAPATTYHGSGSMQACIIARESGGNAQAWNATGHYGLYQFSASTWAAHGGNPADFGHASVAEQNQVYYNTVAADGYSDWVPYDHC